MQRFKLTVEYDGTEFAGFQYQGNHRTIQDELEKAIGTITCSDVRVHGAGRTDTGVHALGQVVSFEADCSVPIGKLPHAMNSLLPRDITVVEATEADSEFHARFSAKSRTYVYTILNRKHPSALFGRYTYHCPDELNVELMKTGALDLLGTHDFVSWANSSNEVKTTTREVIRLDIRRRKSFILIRIEASAFLRGMVRNVVGTLIEVGNGKRSHEDVARITAARNRVAAGPSAPARGLCFVRVRY